MMGRQPCCAAEKKLRKGLWSPEEDEKLATHIARFGVSCWSSIPELAGLQRCGKSCRLRWMNYLRPDLKRGRFSQQEEELIMSLHRSLGNSWSQIAARLPGRSDNEIKNFWNARLRKKLRQEETGRKAASPRRGGGDHQRQKPVFDPFPQQADQDQASAAGIAVRAGAAGVLAADAETVSVETPTPTSDCDGFMTAMADEASLLLGEYLDGSHDGLFWEGHVFS